MRYRENFNRNETLLGFVFNLPNITIITLSVFSFCQDPVERKGTFKLNFLRKIEKEAQNKWENEKVFEENAPEPGTPAWE